MNCKRCVLRFVPSKQFIPEYLHDLFYDGDSKRINSSFYYYYSFDGKLLREDEYNKYVRGRVIIDNKYNLTEKFFEMCFLDSIKMAHWRDLRIKEILDD